MVQQTLDGAATTSRKRNSYSGEVARHKVVWRERQESLTDVQALHVKLQDDDTMACRYKGSKCLCRYDADESRSGACALPGLLGFLPFNAALRIPVSSDTSINTLNSS